MKVLAVSKKNAFFKEHLPVAVSHILQISQNSQENTCARVFFLIKSQSWNFINKDTLAQVFSCEFCEISKSTFFIEYLWWLLLNSVPFQ